MEQSNKYVRTVPSLLKSSEHCQYNSLLISTQIIPYLHHFILFIRQMIFFHPGKTEIVLHPVHCISFQASVMMVYSHLQQSFQGKTVQFLSAVPVCIYSHDVFCINHLYSQQHTLLSASKYTSVHHYWFYFTFNLSILLEVYYASI